MLSRPIRSGKTTTLLKWAQAQPDIQGILTPDVNGIKKLYDISQKKYYDFQITTGAAAEDIRIGKFCLSKISFDRAKIILKEALSENPFWLVIDEIGPLELNGQGFEPVSGEIIRGYALQRREKNLLLVIRSNLLDQVIQHYGIGEYRIFNPE